MTVRTPLVLVSGKVQQLQAGDTLAASSTVAALRNKLINGNFAINQRGYVSGTATTAANQYTLDRWRVVTSGQNATFTTSGVDTTVTAPAGGIEQVVEGFQIEGGTYALSWSGTATAKINGTTIANGSTTTLTAATDVTVQFAGGSVTRAQLELASTASSYERRNPIIEQLLCQRYYWATTAVLNRWSSATNFFGGFVQVFFPIAMRVAPTIVIGTLSGTYTATTPGSSSTTTYVQFSFSASGTVGDYTVVPFTVSAEF